MTEATGTGAGEGTAGATAGAGAAQTWFTGADAETTGWLANRGWDKLTPDKAALEAVKSYREAEKHIGVPPDQLLRMPKDANDKEAWAKLYQKLGVPDTADKYDLATVKAADGTDLDQDTVNALRKVAHENNLPPDAAKSVANAVVKMLGAKQETDSAVYAQKLDQEKASLKANWGSNAPMNLVTAQNAAAKLGVTAEQMSALEKAVGYSGVMEMFRTIGVGFGEDQFLGGRMSAGATVTASQAQAQLDSLMNDTEWVKKFENGSVQHVQQFHNLTRVMRNFVG